MPADKKPSRSRRHEFEEASGDCPTKRIDKVAVVGTFRFHSILFLSIFFKQGQNIYLQVWFPKRLTHRIYFHPNKLLPPRSVASCHAIRQFFLCPWIIVDEIEISMKTFRISPCIRMQYIHPSEIYILHGVWEEIICIPSVGGICTGFVSCKSFISLVSELLKTLSIKKTASPIYVKGILTLRSRRG